MKNCSFLRKLWIRLFWPVIALGSAMVGYQIHGSVFWSVVDAFFWPCAWTKWMIYHEVNLTVIKRTFEFFVS